MKIQAGLESGLENAVVHSTSLRFRQCLSSPFILSSVCVFWSKKQNGENGETAFYIVLAQIELATLLFSQNVFLLKILPPHF